MKRDFDLIKSILFTIESYEGSSMMNGDNIKIEGYTQKEINYHLNLLNEKNFIEAQNWKDTTGDNWHISRLTWDGHEFLDAAKNESVWNKAKQIIAEKGGNISIEVLKSLLQQLLLRSFTS